MSDVVIVDNGGANIASVQFALERLGASAVLSADADTIRCAPRVLLPGVGAAGGAMARLRAAGLDTVLRELTQPLLGICLGMQLLFESSEEGDVACLGVIPGRVKRFVTALPVPHMGWNQLELVADEPLLQGIEDAQYAYFVHSYNAPVGPHTVATTRYDVPFSAAVRHRNFHGVQFHPERSAKVGARILRNFLEAT
ncbi:MAG: imidazole glycerol phosphate synthase subunit HisH [Polyangia bacterium]